MKLLNLKCDGKSEVRCRRNKREVFFKERVAGGIRVDCLLPVVCTMLFRRPKRLRQCSGGNQKIYTHNIYAMIILWWGETLHSILYTTELRENTESKKIYI